MIVAFRVTVHPREYSLPVTREESDRQAREGTGRGNNRVYRQNMRGQWRGSVEQMLAGMK